MLKEQPKKALSKKVKKGFRGYPLATVALYGPTDKKATKVAVGIVLEEHADPRQMKKWHSDDLMNDRDVFAEILEFIKERRGTNGRHDRAHHRLSPRRRRGLSRRKVLSSVPLLGGA